MLEKLGLAKVYELPPPHPSKACLMCHIHVCDMHMWLRQEQIHMWQSQIENAVLKIALIQLALIL